jgi:tricarballylate dehydrogenase
MASKMQRLVIIGHGAAGLAAALSAAEEARSRDLRIEITLLEKAPEQEAGGNTRWSPSNIRMDAPDRIGPEFEDDMQCVSGGRADRNYFHLLATNAVDTIGWLQARGVAFAAPAYYLSAGPKRIQPVGGGAAIVEKLSDAAKAAGVRVRYQASAKRLLMSQGRISAVVFEDNGATSVAEAAAVVLATGGFEGNAAMMREQFGAGAEAVRLISPGTRFNTGDGIRIGREAGAKVSGDWDGMHIEPIDPRSGASAPVVLVYPYGIVVDQSGQRFFDEGAGLVHETWEAFSRDIHFSRLMRIAYAVLDSRLFEIEGHSRAIRSDVPPYRAETIEGLAAQIGVPAANLRQTIDTFNAAAPDDCSCFDATRCDGLATKGLTPAKSNWARPIAKPPYLAYPLVGGLAYTFGGLATSEKAEVLGGDGSIPGLYAAGEITGHFYGTAPNAVAVLRALVFGRIAGREAIGFLQRQNS